MTYDVEVTTRYATNVETLAEAWAFGWPLASVISLLERELRPEDR